MSYDQYGCVCTCIYISASASMNLGVSRQIHAGVCAHFGYRRKSGESTVASGVIILAQCLCIICILVPVHSTPYIGARYNIILLTHLSSRLQLSLTVCS